MFPELCFVLESFRCSKQEGKEEVQTNSASSLHIHLKATLNLSFGHNAGLDYLILFLADYSKYLNVLPTFLKKEAPSYDAQEFWFSF